MAKQRARQSPANTQRRQWRFYHSRKVESTTQSTAQPASRWLKLRRLTLWLISLGIIGYWLWLSPQPVVTANNLTYTRLADYQIEVEKILQHFIYRTKLTFDRGTLLEKLQNKFPEVGSIEVTLPLLAKQPQLRLIVDTPIIALANNQGKWLVNSRGVVVGQVNDWPHQAKLINLIDQTGLQLTKGQLALGSSTLKFIEQLLTQLTAKKIKVKRLTLSPRAQALDVQLANRRYYIKFIINDQPLQQIGQLLAAEKHFKNKSIKPRQYIDVRVAGKIFYR